MARASLCLRVDSPYPGESMSSFLSRAAQFYAMPAPALLKELLQGRSWSSTERRDLDLAPSPMLLQRLSETVRNWQPLIEEPQGFMSWTLAQRWRHAYCPTCFLEDLAAGRTPYFRNDWIPALVTTCWKHGTPLFDWEMVRSGGWRYWPQTWLHKERVARDIPAFMQRHLDLLGQLGTPAEPIIDVGSRLAASEALAYLRQLQALVEKPAAVPMPRREPFRTDDGAFRFIARELVRFVSRYQDQHKELPIATVLGPPEGSDWIAPIPPNAARRRWEFTEFGIRQTGCIRWRRCYALFTARTLLGMERFRFLFPPAPSTAFSPWREWWLEWVRPRLGTEQQGSLDWYRQSVLRDD